MCNHGLLTVGGSIAEAFVWMRRLISACEPQGRAMATGGRIRPVGREVLEMARNSSAVITGGAEWAYHLRQALRNHLDFKGLPAGVGTDHTKAS